MQPRVLAGRVERQASSVLVQPRRGAADREQGRPLAGRGGHQDEVRDMAVQNEPGGAVQDPAIGRIRGCPAARAP